MSDTKFSNDELASIYDYLNGQISQAQMAKEIGRTRTNSYYYVGRAVQYWLKQGTLRFTKVSAQEDLGGKDIRPVI